MTNARQPCNSAFGWVTPPDSLRQPLSSEEKACNYDSQSVRLGTAESLSWTRHTDNIVHAASTKIGLLRRLRKRLSPLIIRQLYLTCIRPSLEYANVAWCGLTKRDQERLEKCNRSAARLITQTMPSSDIPHDILLARAGIPTLLSRRQVAQVKLAFTATRGLLPAHLQATFSSWTVPSSSHAMAPRNPCIRLPRPRKDTQRKSPFYSTFSLWNSLPKNYRDQRTLIPCSFSLRLTLPDPWPLVACCNCSIPGCVCSNSYSSQTFALTIVHAHSHI